ncbi:uncharacterized protein FIBRA_04520 [Fibroporia radiculosa]|uniref:Phosphoglycerate mutase-like protein n=1 Tax=Fibroporia radiculosa TaxID=599839 RepID=J4HWK5_9APHY|nr:uncharacterized protein FIBRA_04520 [Fibroporia radiculosa]CCM02422.1 predicted protein [Fibroporia radiculosa]
MSSDESTVIGIVLLARHGDRLEFYQDPTTYTVTFTEITPLGEQQEWQLGNYLRSVYLDSSSPSYIQGISPSSSIFNVEQVSIAADDSGIDSVIMDSCAALVQGLWHPTPLQNITLANGTTITSPLGGYQYVPITSVLPDLDVSLEGFTDCISLQDRTTAFYNSTAFMEKAEEAEPFLSQLGPYVGNRSTSLENMWNIFDYMNVQSIHNATYLEELPPTFLAQARDLANWHEYNVFTDPYFSGVGNIAFQTMIPGILESIESITNSSDPLKLSYYAINYKPFLSMFNMTGLVSSGSLPAALVDYASAAVFEIRQTSPTAEPVIRFQFKNGTNDPELRPYPLVFDGWDGTTGGDVPVSIFTAALAPAAVNTTLEWCYECNQDIERGCAVAIAAAQCMNETSSLVSRDLLSSVGNEQLVTAVGSESLVSSSTAMVSLMFMTSLILLGAFVMGARKWGKKSHTQIRSDKPY